MLLCGRTGSSPVGSTVSTLEEDWADVLPYALTDTEESSVQEESPPSHELAVVTGGDIVPTTSTSGPTPLVIATIVLPAEDSVYRIEVSAEVRATSASSLNSIEMYNTTDEVLLGRHRAYLENAEVGSWGLRNDFVQATAAGPKTIQLRIFTEGGTMTVDNPLISAQILR